MESDLQSFNAILIYKSPFQKKFCQIIEKERKKLAVN